MDRVARSLRPPHPQRLHHIPRLTILHLMTWTALTAVALVVMTRGMDLTDTDPISVGLLALCATGAAWHCLWLYGEPNRRV